MNADPAELQKFSDLAHRWWDPESEFKPLHQINPLRLDWIDDNARIAGKKVVDIGCGGGLLCEPMARLGFEAGGGKVVAGADPVVLPKALKNPTELSGIRAAHVAREREHRFGIQCVELLRPFRKGGRCPLVFPKYQGKPAMQER